VPQQAAYQTMTCSAVLACHRSHMHDIPLSARGVSHPGQMPIAKVLCANARRKMGTTPCTNHRSLHLVTRQASTLLSDGRVFTIGGSWNGGIFIKNGEIWSQNGNWTLLPGCPVRLFSVQHLTSRSSVIQMSCCPTPQLFETQPCVRCVSQSPHSADHSFLRQVTPMLTNDNQGIFRGDNHGWFFGWTNGMVFQARGGRTSSAQICLQSAGCQRVHSRFSVLILTVHPAGGSKQGHELV